MTAGSSSSVVPKLRFPEFRDAPSWATPHGDTLFDSINNRSVAPGLPVLAITQEHGAIPRDKIDYHVSVTAESVATYKEVCEGDFIISLRSFQGGIEYSRYHGICSPAYVILRRKGNGSDHFFRQLFKSDQFIQQLTRNIEGIRDGKMISYAQFSEQLLPVPEPSEQQKIADCLGSLDDLIAAEGRKLLSLRRHKQGLMQQLLPRPGETVPRLRFLEFQSADEWHVESIDEFALTKTGNRDTQDRVDGGNYPFFVRSQSIERIDTYAYDGEAVLTSGDGVGVGKNFHYIKGRFDFHQRVYCIYDFRSHVLARFFYFYFSEHFGPRVRRVSAKNSVDSVRRSMITEMPVPLPDPAEQETVADCLSSLEALIAGQARSLDLLLRHKQGLLQQLFPSPEEDAR
jgi:type I restriction enzyme, S subunit